MYEPCLAGAWRLDRSGNTMSGDTLSDLLRAVRLRGAVFSYVEGSGPWVVETPVSSQIIPAILPGVEHLMPFHGVTMGSCWAALIDGQPVPLGAGDLVLFPQGDHHIMSSAPGLRGRFETHAATWRIIGRSRATPLRPEYP